MLHCNTMMLNLKVKLLNLVKLGVNYQLNSVVA